MKRSASVLRANSRAIRGSGGSGGSCGGRSTHGERPDVRVAADAKLRVRRCRRFAQVRELAGGEVPERVPQACER